ncbi:MAG: molybdenum cofactor biosynthesis protein MoaE [Archaeoglobaceae archaeon]
MRLFVGDEKIYEELKKSAKAVFIKREGSELLAESEDLRISAKPELILNLLEFFADLGYDFAILQASEEIAIVEEKYGFKISAFGEPNTLKVPEFETLKSIVEKTKKNADKCGAIGIFVGFVRKIENEKIVKRLEYEAFDEILSEKIAEVENKVRSFPGIANAKLYHKIGRLLPGEDIVYIAVAGEHRKDIWEPLMNAVELMKSELPIWKKEVYEDGERWI